MKLLTVKWLLKLIKLPNFVVSTAAVDGLAPPDHDDVVIKWKHFPRYWPCVREFTGPGEFPAQSHRNVKPLFTCPESTDRKQAQVYIK